MNAPVTAVPETLPPLASRTAGSYLDFVEGFREYILGSGADFERRLNQAAEAEEVRRGAKFGELAEIRTFLESLPLTHLRNRLTRSQQEMKWTKLSATYQAQREQLLAELDAWDERGPARLELDPKFVHPPYTNVHFHLQPGGYFKDELGGFLYHHGTKVFFRGENDKDELHAKLVSLVPPPADGNVARVLDLACSIGQSTTAFKMRFPKAEVIGIDHSVAMLRAAHRRASMLGSEVTFAQRLVEDTRMPDDHFDLVFAFIVFHELPQRIVRDTVAEALRVLRPGGVFAIYDFNGVQDQSPYQRYHRYCDARHNGEPYSQDFCDCDLAAILRHAGFSVLKAAALPDRAGGPGYMKHWYAVKG
ncbi:MAG: class I SAM-dependent methyltransferase [Pseudomonadales bacterium]|nr:class I SAM-dependent methyltransferase [Pseudomonadales bacterium]